MKKIWNQPPKKNTSSAKKPVSHKNAKPKKKPEPWKPPFPPKETLSPAASSKAHQIPEVMPKPHQVIDVPFKDVPTEEPQKAPCTTKRDFIQAFKLLTASGKHAPWEVWADFIVMTACSISNIVDPVHFEEREKRYTRIVEKYTLQEHKVFSEMLAHTILALEDNPEQDFLGDIYMEFGLGSKTLCQEFTPYNVSAMMAKITMDDLSARMKNAGIIRLDDPCCGGGSTLIAGINEARKQMEKMNLNFQNHVLVTGQDIDEVAALMSYIQISLLGVAGFFKVGNTFTDPMESGDSKENYWYTPIYCFGTAWQMRRAIYQAKQLLGGLMESTE